MRKELVLKNIEHCDHYLKRATDKEHKKYYQERKSELLKILSTKGEFKFPIRNRSSQSPRKIALKYYDMIQAKQITLVDIAKYEKVNEGSLSKAIFRIRKESSYAKSRSFKKDYL
jgi:hypothetical protein